VAVSLTIIGNRDPRLEELMRSCGLPIASSWVSDIGILLDAHAVQPDVVLIDVRGHKRVPSELPLLKKQHPLTNIVLLATALDPALMLEGMRGGVSECLSEPLSAPDFVAAMTRLIGQRTTAPAGPVFAFVGAKGGVGTTTTAVNVATSLAKLSSGAALMIDLQLVYGDAAVYLGAESRYSVLDALENLHRLDTAFFRSLVVRAPAGLDLLASSNRPITTTVDSRRLATIIEFASAQYPYTVVDVPRSDVAVLDSLDNASTIIVVANQELATVRNAGRMAAALRARYRKAKVMTVINRMDRRSEIGHQDVERAVGATIAHQFPSDYRRALNAMNQGRPLALDNHNELSASFKALARELAGLKDKDKAESDKSSGILGLFPGRRG
jgi:pilus assembly protein CpaE